MVQKNTIVIDDSIAEYKQPAWHTIQSKPASKRATVNKFQARLFAHTAMKLVANTSTQPAQIIAPEQFRASPTYQLFVDVAYACGFVCCDLSSSIDLAALNLDPHSSIASWTFPEIRAYTHTLLRAEQWNEEYSSPLLDAIQSGALALVAERIINDETLYS